MLPNYHAGRTDTDCFKFSNGVFTLPVRSMRAVFARAGRFSTNLKSVKTISYLYGI